MPNRAYLDANFFIRFVESEDSNLLFVFEQEAEGLVELATSELTLAEVLAGAIKTGDEKLAAYYEEFLTNSEYLTVVPVSRAILRDSARIRADIGNKTPDAIHIATALSESCDVFISSDLRMRLPSGLKRIPLERVSDVDIWP